MEQHGNMEIVNHSNGHRANLTFKPAGSNSKDLHRVEGIISDKSYVFVCIHNLSVYLSAKRIILIGRINCSTYMVSGRSL